MAVLSATDRLAVTAEFTKRWSDRRRPTASTKLQIRALFAALDNAIEIHAPLINAALPEPAKSDLTAKEKLEAFYLVIQRRFEVA